MRKKKSRERETEKRRKINEKFKASIRELCDSTRATCEISAEYPARDISDERKRGEGKSEG